MTGLLLENCRQRDLDRQELADYLGVERSAMSAELGKLTKLGILRTQRSHFTLLKPLD